MNTFELPSGVVPLALLVAAFLAAALGVEGLMLLWHQTQSPAVQRLRRRLQDWFPESGPAAHAVDEDARPAAPVGAWNRLLHALEERLLRRASRRRMMVQQLPDALDLMARALRSGHAFSTALQMVADEGPQPLAGEFARVAEQITLGGDPDDAFEALAERVPIDEMRFFVMAVKLQRQTGGQLSEVLGNIARLLTAEGRLSAKVLAALPPVTAGALFTIRPELMAVLWTDPLGLKMLQASTGLMVLGCLWLWHLTRIRV